MIGTEVVREFGEELTGRFLDEVDFDLVGSQVLSKYDTVAAECQPIASKWSYLKMGGRHTVCQRLILPLSTDGRIVDMFLCGATGTGRG